MTAGGGINSISCASPGNCAAGGDGFVVDETNGAWGLGPMLGVSGVVLSVSCASAGNCVAGGYLGSSSLQAFVVDQTAGSWGRVQDVPGTTLNGDRSSAVSSVSCVSAGNCAAGGWYVDSSGSQQAFVVDETNGTWGTAQEVPGTSALNAGFAEVNSVSCTSAGNCAAGGSYDSSGGFQAFVVDETGGSWGTAQEVPGSAALNTGGNAAISSVSCTSAGNCSAGGEYKGSHVEVFVVDETGGSWGQAHEVPGSATLNAGGNAQLSSVSCASAGNCAAGGWYIDSSDGIQAFVVNETAGSWGPAQEVPGTAALNARGQARVLSVSCVSPGNCAAGGEYHPTLAVWQPFVVDETAGSWGTAQKVPGSAALSTDGAGAVTSVSCPAAGFCAAGGSANPLGTDQPFVVNEASASSTSMSLSSTAVTYGNEQAARISVTVTSPYGTPGGMVTINSGLGVPCTITLASGSGSCELFATGLDAGTAQLTATYTGSTDFAASTSAEASITISQATSTTALTLSPAVIAYGDEGAEQVLITLSPQYAGVPTGTVTVSSGSATLCTITETSGSGLCALPAKGLPLGTAQLTASYQGSTNFAASASAAVPLTVITAPAYAPVTPVRILDTRNGTGAPKAPVGPGQTIRVQVTGVDGVPSSGVTAVALNVTATTPTASSFVTVYPDGSTRPVASNLNFTRGETIPNLVVVPVGADGKVDFYNAAGSVNLFADLEGYYTTSGGSWLDTTGPVRIMDTRNGTGVPKAAVGPGGTVSLQVTGVDGVPSSGVTAVVLNVTATTPTASSFVTVYPDGSTRPVASNLNFTRGETIPNLAVVPVGADGKVDFYNAAGSVNLFADLQGYYTTSGGSWLDTTGPVRIMDTRNGTGVPKAPVGPKQTISLQVTGVDGVPASGVTAVVLNVTATTPTASSFVTVYPYGGFQPDASNLNFTSGETIPNLVVVPVGADGKVAFFNAAGSVNLFADLAGYFMG